ILKRGLILGALAGAVLSSLYTAVIIPLFGILLVVTNIPGGRVFDALIGAGMFAICAWPAAVLAGILPGIIIGAAGGLLIGLMVLPVRASITSKGAASIGLLVGTIIIAGAHLLLYPGIIDETQPDGVFKYLPYLFWLALPGAAVLAGSAWVGWKIVDVR
ncbi:MAG: hypothetical protein D6784_04210, partial [Chloroflexi bacterium]